jgi:signal peptidase I
VFVRFASLGEMTAGFLRLLVGVAALWHIYVYAVEDYASVRRFVPAFVVLCLCRVLVVIAVAPYSSAPSRDFVVSTKGDSMLPAVLPGEVLSVVARGSGKLSRGAVLILRNPAEPASVPGVLKRLVAFEGEMVEICGDGIYINNQRWGFLPYGIGYPFAYTSGYALAGNPYKVPSGTVFVMGDNFWNSRDSRFWGALPVDSIKGIARTVIWPPGRMRRLKSPPDNIKPLAADSLTTQPLPAELPGTAEKREDPGDTSPGVR